MRIVAWALGFLALAGLIVLSIAGLSGALAILLTGVAMAAMIGLGSVLGARRTPSGEPKGLPGPGRAQPPSGGTERGPVP